MFSLRLIILLLICLLPWEVPPQSAKGLSTAHPLRRPSEDPDQFLLEVFFVYAESSHNHALLCGQPARLYKAKMHRKVQGMFVNTVVFEQLGVGWMWAVGGSCGDGKLFQQSQTASSFSTKAKLFFPFGAELEKEKEPGEYFCVQEGMLK